MINVKTVRIAKRFGYRPIRELDKHRPYVLLARKNSHLFVIKTEHLKDEAALLKIFGSDNFFGKNKIIIPKLHEHSKDYLIQDYISGEIPDVSHNDFNHQLILLLNRLEGLQKGLHRHHLTKYTKGWNNQYLKNALENAEWFQYRIERWLSDEHSKPKYRFKKNEIVEILKLVKKIKGKTIINFGAFSPAHIRIDKEKLGIFDFGRHLRWAPKHYDRAYLWWGLLFDHKIKKPSPIFWSNLAWKLAKDLPRTELPFYWACIIERLAGLSKDLTLGERNKKRQQTIMNIRNKITSMVINQIKSSL